MATDADATDELDESSDETEQLLNLKVAVDKKSACERHVTVTIAREDIDRYLDEAYTDLMPSAAVPGFRSGRAPRKLVEHRFRDEVNERIKGSLLMDSLGQISDSGEFTAIGEPEFDLDAVEVPEEGPMTFEFDIEVRPEFDLPDWKGLVIERPVRDFSDGDIDRQLEEMLGRYGRLVPSDEPAAAGDFVTVNIRSRRNGEELAEDLEEVVRIRPVLSFRDGKLEDFQSLMEDAKPGDRVSGKVRLSGSAPNIDLRGEEVEVEFEILEVKKLKLPELTESFLSEIGDFETAEALRDAVRHDLQRQLDYEKQRRTRQQITAKLTESADWDLPPGMLKRQSVRELERAVMELRRSGFGEEQIRTRENELRQNSMAATATALKEHFILERISEEEDLDVDEGEYDREISLLAAGSGESPRRVRAHLEKRGLMDVLRNQIVENKVLQLVESSATFVDVSFELDEPGVEATAIVIGGGLASEIPDLTEKSAEPETESGIDAEPPVE